MPKPISRRRLIQKFKALGFEGPFSGSRHAFMKKEDLKIRIPNPRVNDISAGLLAEILRQAGISNKLWEKA